MMRPAPPWRGGSGRVSFRWSLLALTLALLCAPGGAGRAQEGDDGYVERLFREAQQALSAGRVVDGEWGLLEVVRRDPGHVRAQVALGSFYLTNGEARLALGHLQAARSLRPGSDEIHVLLGRTWEALGQPLQAAEQYRQAVRLNARQYEADRRLKTILRELRESKSVLERAAEAFWRQPNLGALTLYGRVVLAESSALQALFEFENLRERLPHLPEIELWVARAQRRLNATDGEIQAYRRYLEARPDAKEVRLVLAERLLDSERFPEAEAVLEPLAAPSAEQGPLAQRSIQARTALLRSRAVIAQGDAESAGRLLLEAANAGLPAGQVAEAFDAYVERFPTRGRLRLTQAAWLRSAGRFAAAAEAYHAAGLMDETFRPEARRALQELLNQSRGANEALLGLGELAYREGRDREALQLLRRVAAQHPADRRASLLRGVLARRQGDLEASLDAFLRYVFSFGDQTGIVFARGNVFWEMGRPDVAEGIWGESPRVFQHYPEVLERLAAYYRDSKHPHAELAAREMLRDRLPERIDNRRRLGEMYAEAGQDAEAAAEWSAIVASLPGDFDLRIRLARTQLRLGQRQAALENLVQASRLRELTQGLNQLLGRELMAAHRYEEALDIYWSLYREQPNHPEVTRALPLIVLEVPAPLEIRLAAAQAAERDGRMRIVVEILEEILRRYPDQADVRTMLAGILLDQGAADDAERVIATAPGDAALSDLGRLRLLAAAQLRQNKHQAAAASLTRIVAQAPDDGAAQHDLGRVYVALERYEEAIAPLEAALRLAPENPETREWLARALLASNRGDQAEPHLLAMLERRPDDPVPLRLLIELYLTAGRWAALGPLLEQWVATHPEDAVARYNLVTAYLRTFDKTAAQPHFDVLRQLNPAQARPLAPYFNGR